MFSNVVLPEFSRPAKGNITSLNLRMFVARLHTYEYELEAFARKKRRERRGERAHFLRVKEVARARLDAKKIAGRTDKNPIA